MNLQKTDMMSCVLQCHLEAAEIQVFSLSATLGSLGSECRPDPSQPSPFFSFSFCSVLCFCPERIRLLAFYLPSHRIHIQESHPLNPKIAFLTPHFWHISILHCYWLQPMKNAVETISELIFWYIFIKSLRSPHHVFWNIFNPHSC